MMARNKVSIDIKTQPRWRWYHGLFLFLLVQSLSSALLILARSARGERVTGSALDATAKERELAQPRTTPPDMVFATLWPILNGVSLWGLLRVLNRPASTPGRRAFLTLQAISWADYTLWSAVAFGLRSVIGRFVLTIEYLGLTVASIVVAANRLHDRELALSFVPLTAWLTFATPLALLSMLWNRDQLLRVGPLVEPKQSWVKPGTGLRREERMPIQEPELAEDEALARSAGSGGLVSGL